MLRKFIYDVYVKINSLFLLTWWLCGFVVAKDFWSTALCIFPPYAFYLVLDQLNKMHHFLG